MHNARRSGPGVQNSGIFLIEATIGFEPMHRGFADLPLSHLGTSPSPLLLKNKTPPPGGIGGGGAV